MMTRFCSKKNYEQEPKQQKSTASSCKKQINKQNSYLLLAFLQSGSVPELDMYESKHFLPGQFVHSVLTQGAIRKHISKAKLAFCVIMEEGKKKVRILFIYLFFY
jgi:hypothetical protein